MARYPFQFRVRAPGSFSRGQLLMRLVFILLGSVLGVSMVGVLAVSYVGLPLYAALRISNLGSRQAYLHEETSRVLHALHWLASFTSWLGLVVEQLSLRAPSPDVQLTIEPTEEGPGLSSGDAPVYGALMRIVTGLPSALVLAVLSCAGAVVWLFSAVAIFFNAEVPDGAHRYLSGVQRYTYRLLAYQACLVDIYPPFELNDEGSDLSSIDNARPAS